MDMMKKRKEKYYMTFILSRNRTWGRRGYNHNEMVQNSSSFTAFKTV